MTFIHEPVLLNEVLEWITIRENGIYCDGTLGGGGHSSELMKKANGNISLYGIDRDMMAIQAATERLKSYKGFNAIHGNFHDAKRLLKQNQVSALDGVLLDLGVSSPQLDTPQRGFSYHEDAPLDMRMDPTSGITAAELLNTYSEKEIAGIIKDYGEEKWAARIASIICQHRIQRPFQTTFDLVKAVDAAIPKAVRMKDDGHPARRTFQAIRIAVNDELNPLDQSIRDFVDMLRPGGRILIITFHSLEDRLVKQCFRKLEHPCTCPPKAPICFCGKKPVIRTLGGMMPPTKDEINRNPRSRSAKLRVAEKL